MEKDRKKRAHSCWMYLMRLSACWQNLDKMFLSHPHFADSVPLPTIWLLSLIPMDLLFYSIQLLTEMGQQSILLTNCATPFHAHILTCLFKNRNHELLWDRPLKWKLCSTRVLLLLFSYILDVCLCKPKAGRKQLAFGRELNNVHPERPREFCILYETDDSRCSPDMPWWEIALPSGPPRVCRR